MLSVDSDLSLTMIFMLFQHSENSKMKKKCHTRKKNLHETLEMNHAIFAFKRSNVLVCTHNIIIIEYVTLEF